MSDYKRFFVAIKGAIFDGDKFLIVKRSNYTRGEHGVWELPGGRLEFGETPEQTLIRELQEEVGLHVDLKKPLNAWSFFRDENAQLVGITYLCRYKGGKVNLSLEHLEYTWVSFDEIYKFDFVPGIVEEIGNWDKEDIWRVLEDSSRL